MIGTFDFKHLKLCAHIDISRIFIMSCSKAATEHFKPLPTRKLRSHRRPRARFVESLRLWHNRVPPAQLHHRGLINSDTFKMVVSELKASYHART